MKQLGKLWSCAGLVVLSALAASCDSAEPSAPQAPLRPHGAAHDALLYPESPYGIVWGGGIMPDRASKFLAAQQLASAGVRVARVGVYWHQLQQSGPAFDAVPLQEEHDVIDALFAAGITPYITLQETACFARDLPPFCPTDSVQHPPKSNHWTDYENYVSQMIDMFPNVTYWGIWNEPNAEYLRPDVGDRLSTYGEIFDHTAPIIRLKGRKVVAVELGGGADVGTGMLPQDWLRSFMSTPNHRQFTDVVAVHWYGGASSNDVWGAMNGYAQVLAQVGASGKELWLTEAGVNNDFAPDWDQYYNVQAIYTAMSWGTVAGWTKTFYFAAGINDPAHDTRGIIHDLGTNAPIYRPAYSAYQGLAQFRVTVTGPQSAIANQPEYWYGRISGGQPPYTYHWEISGDGPKQYFYNVMDLLYTNAGSDFIASFVATDANGLSVGSGIGVTVTGGCSPNCW